MNLVDFDVKAKSEVGSELWFTHPTDDSKKLDIFFIVKGRDSETYSQIKRETQIKMLNKKIGKKKDISPDDFDEAEEDDIENLARLIIGWGTLEYDEDDVKKEKGKKVDYILEGKDKTKYSQKNAVRLLKSYPWIKEQVSTFMWDRANFL